MNRRRREWGTLVAAAVIACLPTAAVLGNVYPSGISVVTDGFGDTCGTAKVNYILNEDADGDGSNPGVKIEVLDNTATVIRTVTIARQAKGMQTFVWDGRKDDGSRAPNGNYTVRITASDFGYTGWTRISDEVSDQLTHFERPRGVAVNTNPAQANYGKIYVLQASSISTASGRAMQDGIYMLNADTSDAGFSTGGYNWTLNDTTYISPWRGTIGPDGHLYVTDYANDLAVEFSEDMATATQLIDASNKTTGQYCFSIWTEGTQAGGDRKIYLVNAHYLDARRGLIQYSLGGNATATPGDTGTQYIGPTYYTFYPRDVARDVNNDWYINQYRASPGGAPVISKFDDDLPKPINTALWEASKDYTYALGIGLCEDKGWVAYGREGNGTVYFFSMTDGSFLFNVVVGRTAAGVASGNVNDVAFDAAGNMYTVDNIRERMRVWSPPDGPNSKDFVTSAITLTKSGTGGPTVTDQPDDITVCAGNNAVFNATAVSGDAENVQYQWLKNGQDISGETGTVASGTPVALTLTSVVAEDSGAVITVRFCDDTGTDTGVVLSDPAILNVGVTFLQAPLSQSVCQNTDATFTVSVTGKTPPDITYQWEKDTAGDGVFADITPGGDSDSVTLQNVQGTDSGTQIRCKVTDACGTVTSPTAVLTVLTGPSISHVGYGATIPAGGSHTMTCYATGTGVLHYQWKRDGNNVGIDAGSLTLRNVTCADAGLYSCEVTDDCGSAERSTAYTGAEARLIVGGLYEVCGNGIDDDCDELVDCDDPDCNNDPNCVPACPRPFADVDEDGDVDQEDFSAYQLCYTSADDPDFVFDPQVCHCFDWDGDADVDDDDLGKFEECASGPAVPADEACAPHPSGPIIINEIAYDMYTSAGVDATDEREFVELYNTGDEAVDISGWLLRSSSGRNFVIPTTAGGPTLLDGHAYYLIGSGNVSPYPDFIISPGTDIWGNTETAIELVDRNLTAKDTVIYERYRDGDLSVPSPEGGVWGQFKIPLFGSQSVPKQSLARHLDGLDTDVNGYDFGLRPETPGSSNHAAGTITAYVVPDMDAEGLGNTVVGLTGSFVGGRVIDPADDTTEIDVNGVMQKLNPKVIAVSPQEGNAIIAWDPSGGGNMVASDDILEGGASYDMYVYLDTTYYGDGITGAESTTYGLVGTTDTIYQFPNPDSAAGFAGDVVTANGNTGIGWVYTKETSTNNPNYLMSLTLCDFGPGGDSSDGPLTPADWTVYRTIDLSAQAPGWHRLKLSYNAATGAVHAEFDAETVDFTTVTDLVGAFYVGYRESLSGQPAVLRPPTFDSVP